MLFPTIQFGIFFPIVFLVLVAPPAVSHSVEAVHDPGELRVLRLVGLALLLPARRVDDCESDFVAGICATRGVAEAGRAHARRCQQPRSAGLLQVLRLLSHVDRRRARQARHTRHNAAARDRAAGGDLLLHVPGVVVCDRRVPRQGADGTLSRLCRLPVVLPASCGRSHRAGVGVPTSAEGEGRPAPPRFVSGPSSHHGRPVQEGRGVELPRERDRRPGLRRAAQRTPVSRPCSRRTATRSRSTPTSRATPTSPSGARCYWASSSLPTSTPPTRRDRFRISGGAGI